MSTSGVPSAELSQQNNFNPSWMRSTFHGGVTSSPRVSTNEEEDYPLAEPIFVKNRYGREDLLALVGRKAKIPEGLSECPYFIKDAKQPIVCSPYSENEARLQQNINSSKAMSQLSYQERVNVAEGGVYGATTPSSNSTPPRGGGTSGGWTPVKSTWGRGGSNQATPNRGTSVSRPYVPARGAARNIGSANGGDHVPDEGQLGANASVPFGQRFTSANRGRGGTPTARGGSTTASAFNSRAQGLYDPRDPKDRPRNHLRSTSDEGDNNGAENVNAASAAGATQQAAWSAAARPAWDRENSWNNKDRVAAWSRENSSTTTSGGAVKSESGGTMPEWMDDGDVEEKDDAVAEEGVSGSFDEQGRFRETQHNGKHPTQAAQVPMQVPRSAWGGDVTSATATNVPTSIGGGLQLNADAILAYNRARSAAEAAAAVGQSPLFAPSSLVHLAQSAAPPPTLPPKDPTFYYLDPTKTERGPFDKAQMDAWFKLGYFTDDLQVRRHFDTTFKMLGQLCQINGSKTPFDYKEEPVVVRPPPQPQPQPFQSSFGNLFSSSPAMWPSDLTSTSLLYGANFDPAALERKRQEERAREEQKLNDLKNQLFAEMQRTKEQQEREIREKHEELLRQQEEVFRREREMKETAEELQNRLTMQRKALEEEAKRLDAEKAKKAAEERAAEDARRAEEQRRKMKEDEERARKQAEEERKRRAEEAAEEERRRMKAAEAEATERIRQMALAEQKKKEEAAKKAVAAAAAEKEKERLAQLEKEKYEVQEAWAAAPRPKVEPVSFEDDGWNVVGSTPAPTKSKSAPKAAPWSATSAAAPREKTLKEIQEEEERQLRAEKAQTERLRKEEAALNLQQSGTWANASQKLQWTQPAPTTKAASKAPAWGGAGIEPTTKTSSPSPFWDGPTLQAANRAPAPAPAKKSAPVAAKAPPKPKASPAPAKDPFRSWVAARLSQLSSTVDADVLASFLEAVDSPDEVEDYIVGYLGESKAVKEFVKDFLHKRSDMRSGRRRAEKDDLSSASVAPVAGSSGAAGASGAPQQGKKKKTKGTRLVVDGACLGFRATSDPNRVNQGEIETVPLQPGQRR